MYGFIFDIVVLLIGIVTSYYFFHKDSDKKKSKIYGGCIFALCLIYGLVSYVRNVQPTPTTATTISPKDIVVTQKDSVIIKHDTVSIKEQKIFPGIANVTIREPLAEGKEFHVDVGCTNFGESPAIDFKMEIHLSIVSPDEIKDLVPKDRHFNTKAIDLLPKQSLNSPIGFTADRITPDLIKAIDKKECFIILWCAMEYKDGSGKIHRPKPTIERYVRPDNQFSFLNN